MAERRFDEEEVALILRQAMQPSAGGAATGSDGLTLAQVQEIAAEVGIDPRAVAAAASALDTRVVRSTNRLLGAPMTRQYERWVEGAVNPDDYPDIVLAIRRVMERHGIVNTDLNELEWRARSASGGRYVTVRPAADRTLVRVLGNYRDGALGWFSAAGTMGAIVALAVLKSTGVMAALGLGVAPLILLAGYLPARWVWQRLSRSENRVLTETLEEVTKVLHAKRQTTEAAPSSRRPLSPGSD